MDNIKAQNKDYEHLTINDILRCILKYKHIVIICVVLGIAAGIAVQNFLTGDDPKLFYYSKATMIITSKNAEGTYQASGSMDNPSASDVAFAQNLVLTVSQLAKSNYVLNLVIGRLGDDSLTPDKLSEYIDCKVIEKTAFIEVRATWPDEEDSIRIVNALMDVLPDAMTEKLDIGSVTVVDYASKSEPVKKFNVQYILLFAAVGIAAGIFAGVLPGILNPKVYTSKDINTYLRLNAIAEIPYINNKSDAGMLVSRADTPPVYREACAAMASVFQYTAARKGAKVIYITSAVSDEGKTNISINLALTLSAKGKKVVLIDCDSRRPAVGEQLGLDVIMSSLQDVLSGKVEAEDALIAYGDNLRVIRSDISETPVDIKLFGGMLEQLRQHSDYIILDTPPVGLVSDALLLNGCVDGVLYVIKNDYADMQLIADSINSIRDSGADILGCILNAKKSSGKYYNNRYYKKYYKSYLPVKGKDKDKDRKQAYAAKGQ
ncbi:MAG: AAA family ATPase [Eubacteriales bacterium]|nr:AAA family ATPase [Eubacteriales bacterium]